MGYSIVFSSQTGNTELIARRIRKVMGEDGCLYFGSPEHIDASANEADTHEPSANEKPSIVFVGSWTDKGAATPEVTNYLRSLDGARVFLFGTCGFGASDEYFNEVLTRIRNAMPASCELMGSFMCQGKMPQTVRKRYEAMLAAAAPASSEARRAQMLIDNFDAALAHPNNDDLRALDADLREAGLI